MILITFDTTLGVAGESVERARDVNSPFELIELDTYTPLFLLYPETLKELLSSFFLRRISLHSLARWFFSDYASSFENLHAF